MLTGGDRLPIVTDFGIGSSKLIKVGGIFRFAALDAELGDLECELPVAQVRIRGGGEDPGKVAGGSDLISVEVNRFLVGDCGLAIFTAIE